MKKKLFTPIKGQNELQEFLSETSEWHAIWMGFYSSFFTLQKESLPDYLEQDIRNEYHYYTLGHFIGRIAQIIIAITAAKYGLSELIL